MTKLTQQLLSYLAILITALIYSTTYASEQLIQASINAEGRFESDVKRDATRKPIKVMEFSTIKSGDTVLDLFSGGGYYSDIISRIVGDEGHVVSHNNQAYIEYLGKDANARFVKNRLSNVTRIVSEADDLALMPDSYDVVMMVLTFHDFYYVSRNWPAIDVKKLLQKIKLSLKESGSITIIDHHAVAGSGEEMGGKLHRIDIAIVKDAMAKAGFVLTEEANFLENKTDPLDISMGSPEVRGKTSRFVLRYKKP